MNKYKQYFKQYIANNKRTVSAVSLVVAFGLIGIVLMRVGDAAVYTAAFEAESGTRSGNAAAGATAGASGGASVAFGTGSTGAGGGGGTGGGTSGGTGGSTGASRFGPGVRSGLPWHSGAHVSNDIGPHDRFGEWRGRPLDAYILFTTRDSWGNITGLSNAIERVSGGKVSQDAVVSIATPLFPTNEGSYSACASNTNNTYTGYWQAVGRTISSAGWNQPKLVLRLSWEFNGNWYKHSVGTNVDGFKNCWKNAVQSVRATANKVSFDWNFNAHGSQSCNGNVWSCYPGDEWVDIIGIDNYDMYPPSGSTDASWNNACTKSGEGMCNAATFARQHGKMLSVPEWGVSLGSEGNGGMDNPSYIRQMAKFFYQNRDIMAYDSYYNAPLSVEPGNVGSGIWPQGGSVDGSNSSAEYLKWFGPNGTQNLQAAYGP